MLYSSEAIRQLIAIRDQIDTPDKWCQDTNETKDGRLCVFEAGVRSVPNSGFWVHAIAAAIMVLYPERAEHIHKGTLPAFNDHGQTTHADVMCVIAYAIAHAP